MLKLEIEGVERSCKPSLITYHKAKFHRQFLLCHRFMGGINHIYN